MVTTDPIADLIIRLKNANAVGKESVAVPYSKLKEAIAEKLRTRGFVGVISKRGKKVTKFLDIDLAYDEEGKPRITNVERISKPGRRLYGKSTELYMVRQGHGSLIVSTPKGILTGNEARKEKIGGELLFKVW